MKYEIDYSPLKTAMRHNIDMAVHHAIKRFERDLPGDQVGLVHKIARAAAETAMEQFCSYANAELRLIEIDYERRGDEMLRERSVNRTLLLTLCTLTPSRA